MTGDLDDSDLACQVFVTLVTDYLEGALPGPVLQQVQAHLAECPDCAEYLDEVRRTAAALGHVPVRSLSERTREGLLEAFRGYRAG
jgi:anti-sigma factor RsiW